MLSLLSLAGGAHARRRRSSATSSSGRSSRARSPRPATRRARGEPSSFKSLYAFLIAPALVDRTRRAPAYAAVKYLEHGRDVPHRGPGLSASRGCSSRRARRDRRAFASICTSALFYAGVPAARGARVPDVRAVRLPRRPRARRRRPAVDVAAIVALPRRDAGARRARCVGAACSPLPRRSLWLVGPRARRLRARLERASTTSGAAILALGALIVAERDRQRRTRPSGPIVTQSCRHRMWTLGLEAGSALAIGLGVLPADRRARLAVAAASDGTTRAGARSPRSPRRVDRVTSARTPAIKAAYLSTVVRDARRGAQPDLPRPAADRRRGRVLHRAPALAAGALAVAAAFVGWLVLALRLPARLPVLRGARLRHRGDGEPLVRTGTSRRSGSGSPSRASSLAAVCRAAVRRAARRRGSAARCVAARGARGRAGRSPARSRARAASQAGATQLVGAPAAAARLGRPATRGGRRHLPRPGDRQTTTRARADRVLEPVDQATSGRSTARRPGPGPTLTPDLAERERHAALRPGLRLRARRTTASSMIGKPVESQRVADAASASRTRGGCSETSTARARRLDRQLDDATYVVLRAGDSEGR